MTENHGVPSSNLGLGTNLLQLNLLQLEERAVDGDGAEPGERGTMAPIVTSIEIERPPEEVFAYVMLKERLEGAGSR